MNYNLMRLHCVRIVVLAAALLFLTLPRLASAEEFDLLIRGGNLFDSTSLTFRPNQIIAIRDGKFVSLDAGADATAQTVIELTDDDYILPGIVDCHAHYNVRVIKKRREEFHVVPITYLANGVTTTFSCGEFDPEGMMKLRKGIESGEKIGPHLINSGPYFGRARPSWRGQKDESEIREEVDFWAGQGVGGFKAKAIGPDELRVLVDQAHKHHLTVTGHLDSGFRGSVNPRDAIDMGIDRIEHFLGGDGMPDNLPAYSSLAKITSDSPEYKKIVDHYLKHGTWFDATITAYGYFGRRGEEYDQWINEREFFTPFIQELVQNRGPDEVVVQFEEIYQAKQTTIKSFFDAGGKISLGTDHFSNGNYLPGFGAHREMDALSRAGIPNGEVIRIATLNGATALGIDNTHGSISVDKVADAFIVSGNPLDNIRNTRNVKNVICGGRVYDSKQLLDSVKGKLGPESETEQGDW
ncbi:MAG: amidohydrolase family protein [Pirellulaceae bacterium]